MEYQSSFAKGVKVAPACLIGSLLGSKEKANFTSAPQLVNAKKRVACDLSFLISSRVDPTTSYPKVVDGSTPLNQILARERLGGFEASSLRETTVALPHPLLLFSIGLTNTRVLAWGAIPSQIDDRRVENVSVVAQLLLR